MPWVSMGLVERLRHTLARCVMTGGVAKSDAELSLLAIDYDEPDEAEVRGFEVVRQLLELVRALEDLVEAVDRASEDTCQTLTTQ